jgi:NhaP-type Na+/H+ or K+/H+ antiporter
MNSNTTVPRIDTIAIVLIIAFLLNLSFQTLSPPFLKMFFGMEEFSVYNINVHIATIVNLTMAYLLNIVTAVWTYKEAKKQEERPLTWTVFALFFGLIAVVAFYLVLILKTLQKPGHHSGQEVRKKEI